LNSHKFQWCGFAVGILEAKRDYFANAFHEGIEVFGLGVATTQSRDARDVESVFVSFNKDGKFARGFHFRYLR